MYLSTKAQGVTLHNLRDQHSRMATKFVTIPQRTQGSVNSLTAHGGVGVVSLQTGSLYPPINTPGTHFC